MRADLALKAPVPATNQPPHPHVDYLDGVRGVAALYVTLCHAWSPLFQLSRTPWGRLGVGFADYGHQAVDVFLVLSGFCLMLPVVRHGTLAGGAWGFYVRRARRILPPYYAALGLCLLLLLLLPLFSHHHGARFTPAGLAVNTLLLQDLFPPLANQFDAPTWTVAVEWKIYFLFPLLVWLLRRAGPGAVLLLTAALGAGLTGLMHHLAPAMPLDHTCPWFTALFGLGVCAGWATGRPPTEKWLCGLGAATVLFRFTCSGIPLSSGTHCRGAMSTWGRWRRAFWHCGARAGTGGAGCRPRHCCPGVRWCSWARSPTPCTCCISPCWLWGPRCSALPSSTPCWDTPGWRTRTYSPGR